MPKSSPGYMQSNAIQVVIPAGGFATRLGSLTEQTPKILLPVNGKPFLWHLIEWLSTQDITRVHLCLGHMAQKIIDALPNLTTMEITFTIENKPLGVAGALSYARSYLDQVFVMIYGDVLPNMPLIDPVRYFKKANSQGLLTVIHNENAGEPSNILVKDGMVVQYCTNNEQQKCSHLDIGITVLRREALNLISNEKFMSDKEFYKLLVDIRELLAFETSKPSYEIGSIDGYKNFQREIWQKENL